MVRGRVTLEGITLEAGDGATFEAGPAVEIIGEGEAEVLWFDLA